MKDPIYNIEMYGLTARHYSNMIQIIVKAAFKDSLLYGWTTTYTTIKGIIYVSLFNGVYILYPCGTLRWINNSSYTEEEIKRL